MFVMADPYMSANLASGENIDVTTEDLIEHYRNPQRLNRYAYCLNNPLIYVDPLGLYESPWYLSWVPGQHLYDSGVTAIENGNYGQALSYFTGMLGEQVMTALTFGQGYLAKQATVNTFKPGITWQYGNLPKGVMGTTDKFGNITIQNGLKGQELFSTVRHEGVHQFLSPRQGGLFSNLRADFGIWSYNNSNLVRFSEEAIAETYASGSLLKGIMHSFNPGYGISYTNLFSEASLYFGGTGYAAYETFNYFSGEK